MYTVEPDSITKLNEGEINEQAFVDVEVGSQLHNIRFKMDIGAIPLHLFKKLFKNVKPRPATHARSDYGGEKLDI